MASLYLLLFCLSFEWAGWSAIPLYWNDKLKSLLSFFFIALSLGVHQYLASGRCFEWMAISWIVDWIDFVMESSAAVI